MRWVPIALLASNTVFALTIPNLFSNGTTSSSTVSSISTNSISSSSTGSSGPGALSSTSTTLTTTTSSSSQATSVSQTSFPSSHATSTTSPSSMSTATGGAAVGAVNVDTSSVTSHAPTGNALGAIQTTATSTYTTTTTVTGPIMTLIPAIHFSVDVTLISNLYPAYDTALHFSGSGTSNPLQPNLVADVSISLIYPAVVLDYSSSILAYYDGANTITVVFASAVHFAVGNSWQPGTVLVTYQEGYGDGGHIYFLSVSITCDSATNTCIVTGTDVGLEGAVSSFDITWGKYMPNLTGVTSSTGASGTSSSGSGGASTPGFPVTASNGTANGTLPSCSFGDTFDQCLDDQIGYLNFDFGDFTSSYDNFAPGLAGTGDDPTQFDPTALNAPTKRALRVRSILEKRCCNWSIVRFFKKAANVIAAVVTAPARIVYTAVVQIAKQIPILKDIVNHEFTQSINKGFVIQVPKAGSVKTVSSSFSDNSYPIYTSANGDLAVYCVDCGVNGAVNIAGQAAVSIANGLTTANVGVNGNVLAILQIGVDAKAQFSKKFQKDLFEVGIPGLSIPKIVTVGPSIKVSTSLELALNAEGHLLVGAKVGFPAFAATLDFLDSSKSSQSGFQPQIEKVFNASGTITASADFGIPIGLNIGIDILSGTYSKQIALVEQPGIHAQASFSASSSLSGGTTFGDATCPGIAYGIDFTNKVFITIPTKPNYDIFSTAIPVVSGCYTIGTPSSSGISSSSSSATVMSSASSSTSATMSDSMSETNSDSETATPESPSSSSTEEPTSSETATAMTSSEETQASEPTTTSASSASAGQNLGRRQASETSASTASTTDAPSASDGTNQDALTDASPASDDSEGSVSDGTDSDTSSVDESASSADDAYTFDNPLSDGVADDDQAAEDGVTYASIQNTENNVLLILGDDSNLYLDPASGSSDSADPAGSSFMIMSGFVAGSVDGEILHYYKDSMDTYGVSRFRASYDSEIPKTADSVFLKPIADDDQSLVAVSTSGDVFFILTCQIPSRGTMTFLAKDPVEGATMLQSIEVQNTITGGVVTECFLAPLTMGASTITQK